MTPAFQRHELAEEAEGPQRKCCEPPFRYNRATRTTSNDHERSDVGRYARPRVSGEQSTGLAAARQQIEDEKIELRRLRRKKQRAQRDL